MCGISYPARWIFHFWRVLDGLLSLLILLIILNVIRLLGCFVSIVSDKCMLLCLHSYLPWATISALYYALLYLLITCSPHLYTIGANKWWWWFCNARGRAFRSLGTKLVYNVMQLLWQTSITATSNDWRMRSGRFGILKKVGLIYSGVEGRNPW